MARHQPSPRPSHVAIVAVGCLGDLQPLLPVASALLGLGPSASAATLPGGPARCVTVLTHACFEPAVRSAGAQFADVGPSLTALRAAGSDGDAGSTGAAAAAARRLLLARGPRATAAAQAELDAHCAAAWWAAAAACFEADPPDLVVRPNPHHPHHSILFSFSPTLLPQHLRPLAPSPPLHRLAQVLGFYHGTFLFMSLCEHLGLPSLLCSTQPLPPSRAHPPPVAGVRPAPASLPLSGRLNAAAAAVVWPALWRAAARPGVAAARAAAGLPPPPRPSPLPAYLAHPTRPQLYLFSEALLPRPCDYPPTAMVVGAPAAPAPKPGAALPPAVAAFLAAADAAGDRVVLVTLGSMGAFLDQQSEAAAAAAAEGGCGLLVPPPRRRRRDEAAALAAVAAAAAPLPRMRLLLMAASPARAAEAASAAAALAKAAATAAPGCRGWCGAPPPLRPSAPLPLVACASDVPHALLLPRVALVVCHGGSGTAHAALRAGIPALALPVQLLWDQVFWGDHLAAVLRSHPAAGLTAEGSSPAAIRRALVACLAPATQERARAAAARMAAEQPAAAAAAVILAAARAGDCI